MGGWPALNTIVLKGRAASKGIAEGHALLIPHAISFLGDIDIMQGTIRAPLSPLKGCSISGSVLVFPSGRGSTADPYGLYMLKKAGKAPAAIVNIIANPTTVAGAIVSHIPMVYGLEQDSLDVICAGDYLLVDGENGTITISRDNT
jgi:predicted aconitase with swiveling domain